MEEKSFLAGLELGKFLQRLTALERGLSDLRTEFDSLKAKGKRVAILAILWIIALGANGSTDRAAELVIAILRAWAKN
jgi:hypothetical protein